MIRSYGLRVGVYLWRFRFFRWGAFHGPAGALNYTVAFVLFATLGVDMYIATLIGHYVHVALGFLYDRDVTFRAIEKRGIKELFIYFLNDFISLGSILLTMYLLVDVLAAHLLLIEYYSWSADRAVAVMRAGPAMLIGTALSYSLNKKWTFNEQDSQHTPT